MRRRSGLTLMESVLGLTLVSLALVALVATLNSALLLSARSQHMAQSEQILEQLSEFYAQDYVHGYGDTIYSLQPLQAPDQLVYQRQFRLSTYSTDLAVPIRRLEVTVSWQWKGRNFQRNRVRLLCRPGR